MQTNSQAQQTTRRMTAAQKAAVLRERIAADHALNVAHAARFQATQAMWHAAYAAGCDAAQLHALDMALMCGADPNDLLRTIDPRSADERMYDDLAAETYATLADARPH